MDLSYGLNYKNLYFNHWWWRARAAAIVSVLHRRSPVSGYDNILDIGCGDGLFFDHLLKFGNVDGVEPCADLVNADAPHYHRIHVCPFDQNFQPGKLYSVILMLDVLEHFPDPVDTLRHALALLTRDGTILITVPAFRVLRTNQDVINHHFTRFTKESLRAVAQKAGMRIESEHYWFQWLFPLKLLQRGIEQLFRLNPRIPKIPPAPINTAAYLFSRFELALAQRVFFPFGSSLFVVAGKATN